MIIRKHFKYSMAFSQLGTVLQAVAVIRCGREINIEIIFVQNATNSKRLLFLH